MDGRERLNIRGVMKEFGGIADVRHKVYTSARQLCKSGDMLAFGPQVNPKLLEAFNGGREKRRERERESERERERERETVREKEGESWAAVLTSNNAAHPRFETLNSDSLF